ncbi:unnamed protein product [Owenia fusiformis]|uniref:Uncharacterized protein n=1 Tax=Owenia fusiformis TaxID=6347 RepID=A0A8S4PWS7_OWEFU|nr:unnamed protein product [Owenia fusiformis]
MGSSFRGNGMWDYKNDNFREYPQGVYKPREREISTVSNTSDRVFNDINDFSLRSNGSENSPTRSWNTRDSLKDSTTRDSTSWDQKTRDHVINRNIDNIRSVERHTDSDTSQFSQSNGRIPHAKQNGTLSNSRLPLNKSLSLSKRSLNLSRTTLYGKDYGVQKSLISLGLLAILSLVLVVLAMQLLFKLHARQELQDSGNSLPVGVRIGILTETLYSDLLEVAIVLTTVVLMLDMCCMLVCSVQCILAAKILKVPQGEERAFKYLQECANTRFLSIAGFYLSVPLFLLVVFLFVLMELRTTSAIISTVILGLGIVYSIVAVLHSAYFWRVEKVRANAGAPVWDPNKSGTNELSTLV